MKKVLLIIFLATSLAAHASQERTVLQKVVEAGRSLGARIASHQTVDYCTSAMTWVARQCVAAVQSADQLMCRHPRVALGIGIVASGYACAKLTSWYDAKKYARQLTSDRAKIRAQAKTELEQKENEIEQKKKENERVLEQEKKKNILLTILPPFLVKKFGW